jgi:hypothetical protein
MRIACLIPTATDTHSEYVTLIVFPLQQWLYERASMYCVRTVPYVNFRLQKGSNACSKTVEQEIRLDEITRSCLRASGMHSMRNVIRFCSHLNLKPQVLWISPSNDAYKSNVSISLRTLVQLDTIIKTSTYSTIIRYPDVETTRDLKQSCSSEQLNISQRQNLIHVHYVMNIV